MRVLSSSALAVIAALIAAVAAPSVALGADGSVPAPPVVHYVVDTSGSMSGTPLEQAKQAVTESINRLPEGTLTGVRSYGGSCGNGGQLVLPVGTHAEGEVVAAVSSLSAGGGTPTGDALRAAASDLPSAGDRVIVLISDGQSGCGDPCRVAADLKTEFGVDFRVHGVGFAATAAAEAELSCIADATGGQYVSVDDQEGLEEALGELTGGVRCADVVLYGLRGSGEDQGLLGDGFGSTVAVIRDAFEARSSDELRIEVRAVDYPALPVPIVGDWKISPLEYINGMVVGADLLDSQIAASRALCTGEDEEAIVVAGYSQGAGVAHMAWDRLTKSEQRKAALILVADPLRSRLSTIENTRGAAAGNGFITNAPPKESVRQYESFHRIDQPEGGFVKEVCDQSDPVCHSSGRGAGPLERWYRGVGSGDLGSGLRLLGDHTRYATVHKAELELVAVQALRWAGAFDN